MTLALIILAILNTLGDAMETTYALGEFTRTTIVPAIIYTYVATEYVVTKAHQGLVKTFDDGEQLFQSVSWG